MKNDDLARELAEDFAEYRRFWASPPEPGATERVIGQPMRGPLSAYGPVMEGNIRCAIWLQVMYYGESVRRLRKAWSRLPPEFRAQVLEHFERLDKDSGEEWCWRAIKELNLCPEMFRDPRK